MSPPLQTGNQSTDGTLRTLLSTWREFTRQGERGLCPSPLVTAQAGLWQPLQGPLLLH